MIAKDIISEVVLSVFLTPLNSMPYKFKLKLPHSVP